MTKATQPIPPGLRNLTPQLVASDARALLDFLKKAFGAEGERVMTGPDGKGIMHGHVRIGESAVFVSDAVGFAKPTTANLFLYVSDVDTTFKKAVAAGAKPLAPANDMFWGDRWGMVEDPFGNVWQIATHVEDLTPEEMLRRMRQ